MNDMKSELGLNFNQKDIHDYEFRTGFRGYSKLQVDEMLDQVIKDYVRMFEEIERLRTVAAGSAPTEYATRYELDLLKRQVDRLREAVERR